MQQTGKDLIGRLRLLNRPVTGSDIYSPIISQLSSLMGLSKESYSKKWKVLHQWHVSVHSVRSIDWNCGTLSHEQVQTVSNTRAVREIQLISTLYWTKGWIQEVKSNRTATPGGGRAPHHPLHCYYSGHVAVVSNLSSGFPPSHPLFCPGRLERRCPRISHSDVLNKSHLFVRGF